MSVFITGATGFIGKYVALQLAGAGHQVHALVRSSADTTSLSRGGVRLFQGDLLEPASIRAAMKGCQQVFHLAGFARAWHKDRSTYHRINVDGTRNIMDAAMDLGVLKTVVVSTAGVLPPSADGRPVSETAGRKPDIYTEYERSKSEAEALVMRYGTRGLPVVVVQPTKVFGPGPVDESNSAALMIREYLRGKWKIVPGDGSGIMDYVYVEDVADGIHLAMEKGTPGEAYILGAEAASYQRFFDTVAAYAARPHRTYKLPYGLMMAVSGLEAAKARILGLKPLITPEWIRKIPYNWSKDSGKARQELGYRPRSFEEAVRLTVDWLRKTGQV